MLVLQSSLRVAFTLRVGAGLDSVEQFHVANIIDVDLVFQHDNETLPVEFHWENRCRESQLADGRLTLII
jgi:hypothetical protein